MCQEPVHVTGPLSNSLERGFEPSREQDFYTTTTEPVPCVCEPHLDILVATNRPEPSFCTQIRWIRSVESLRGRFASGVSGRWPLPRLRSFILRQTDRYSNDRWSLSSQSRSEPR